MGGSLAHSFAGKCFSDLGPGLFLALFSGLFLDLAFGLI
jgi:hypothetical protein